MYMLYLFFFVSKADAMVHRCGGHAGGRARERAELEALHARLARACEPSLEHEVPENTIRHTTRTERPA